MANAGDFHKLTKYSRQQLPSSITADATHATPAKRYPASLPRLTLARPEKLSKATFWELVARRRSVREYAAVGLTAEELFLLLWSTQGITQPGHLPLRATPSAGARYPLETYVVVNRLTGAAPGLYYWELPEERLVLLRRDEGLGQAVAGACLDQQMCAEAACVFLWTAVFARTLSRYGDRGWRYIYLDAGHVGQNLQLAATALGLGSCNIAALFDDEVNQLLGIDGDAESIIYAATVGRPANG